MQKAIKIAHIADVHWRSLSRHDEYKEVFIEFIKQVKEQEIDHIFIGGDLYHTKTTGISPEYIDQISWWFNAMAEVAKVHIILGNHDGNLVNLSRQDSITPILNAINNPNIFLYKQSGVYEFTPGYNWCVFSLFDEEGWDKVKPIPGMVNIACYHGCVHGSKTEVDWALEGDLKVGFFEGYDYVFLGDIHKTQFLDYRDVEIEIDEQDLHLYPDAEIIMEL